MFLQTQGITKEFGKLRAVNDVTLEIVRRGYPCHHWSEWGREIHLF